MMFDTLTQSLQGTFKKLRGYGKLTEKNIQDALREVRLALLEADVNYKVAKDFIAAVKEQCLGEDVLNSVTPGQQMIKRVHDEMIRLLGSEQSRLDQSEKPSKIMMIGLHGAGKTTTSGKLARNLKESGKKVTLVACDIRRPAAVDQLKILAEQVGVGFVTPQAGETVPDIGKRAMKEAAREGTDWLIFDTGGRFQIDEELVQELKELRSAVKPRNVLLVLDAAMGQESVDVATKFNEALGLTGLILTKLDGDARGGAALSVQSVARCPILYTGVGEHLDNLEPFFPDRMASRILGMGDVISFVEKAQGAFDVSQLEKMETQLKKKNMDLEDFLAQLQQMKKLGPLENLLDMMPNAGKISGDMKKKMAGQSESELKKAEAIIQSMTPYERRKPQLLNGSRRKRIAKGSGTTVSDINGLLKRFKDAQKMMKKMKNMQKGLLRFAK
ncbi:MAG: signal recognition particle protein [Spartobacteria bacterium]|nr:signal recognition particle protein [Spartobacteria bacterium]